MIANLNLLPNEGIILQGEDFIHNKKTINELFLTNLNIKYLEKIKGGKGKYEVVEYPLNQIKIINGKPQVSVIDDRNNGAWVLQILFKNGAETFACHYGIFDKIKIKAELDNWARQINIVLTGGSYEIPNSNTIIGSVKNMLESVGVKIKPTDSEKVTTKCIGCMAPISGIKGQSISCKYCDTEQTL